MPSTRRRFLTGTAAVAALLAGCNETDSSGSTGTVTPVDVPRTDRQILREASEISYPDVSKSVIVSDTHQRAAIRHVESVIERLETVLAENDVDFSGFERRGASRDPTDNTEDVRTRIKDANERIETAREDDPSSESLRSLERALRTTSVLLGFVLAETGQTELADVEATLEAERAAVADIKDGLEYRIAQPVEEHLPTLYAAETKLSRSDQLQFVADTVDDADPKNDQYATEIGQVRRSIELHRRRRDDAKRFIDTATDADAPPLRDAIDRNVVALRESLEPIASEYRDWDGGSENDSIASDLRRSRASVGRRTSRWLSNMERHRTDGSRVLGLRDGLEQRIEFAAIDAAVSRSLARLDGREFLAEAVINEKQRAVAAVEGVAGGSAFLRDVGRRSTSVLDIADRNRRPDGVAVDVVARTYFLYAVAAEWATRADEQCSDLLASLQAKQS
ncbi:MAG: hypothetical protein ACI8UR_000340 [Natronomonas sp.]|jgi:hypothetical protein|uniref:hypothetical protein n=1 Tax=Natronomonas sp. TaxID=2184060 RepID=UPI00398A44ED